MLRTMQRFRKVKQPINRDEAKSNSIEDVVESLAEWFHPAALRSVLLIRLHSFAKFIELPVAGQTVLNVMASTNLPKLTLSGSNHLEIGLNTFNHSYILLLLSTYLVDNNS